MDAAATPQPPCLIGAHGGAPGAIVAVGTGSVGLARFADGRQRLVGGWGFGVGDEGRGPLAAAAGVPLATLAASRLEATANRQRAVIAAWCAGAGAGRYPVLAPLVFDSAAADTVAAQLLQRATAEALDPHGTLPLAITGSIGQRLAAQLPTALRARCVAPAGDSAQGALLALIADLAGRDNTTGTTTGTTTIATRCAEQAR